MKKKFGIWLIALLAYGLWPMAYGLAQVSTTPNLGLSIINPGTQNWGPIVNQNFVILDSKVPTLNMSCADGQVPAWAGGKFSICTTPTTAIDQAANYNWTGTHAFAKALTITGKQVCLADGTNCPSAGAESDPVVKAITGIVVGNGSALFGRSITNTGGGFTITNANGTAGNINIDPGPTIVRTGQANAYTTGAQNFSAASSFTIKQATNYVPASDGMCGEDTVAFRLRCNLNGVVYTLAHLSEIQPLSTNLTALAGLTGATATSPVFTAAGTMSTMQWIACVNSGGNVLHVSSVAGGVPVLTCDASASGLSGATANQYLVATGATTFAASADLTRTAGGIIGAPNGLTVGNVTTNYLSFDTSAVTGAKTWTAMNQSGTVRLSTGVFTSGNIVKTDVNGFLVDGGAAGTGTWTDASNNTSSGNKTIVDTAAGGTNTLTIGIAPFWDAASLTLPSTSTCTLAATAQINSGPSVPAVNCTDASTSTFEGQLALRQAVATVTFTLTVNDTVSSSHHFAGDFSAMCRANNTAVNSTWGTSQSVDITMTTASNNYTGTTAAVTPSSSPCAAGSTLFWRFVVNTTPFTDTGTARVLSVLMKQSS